MDFNIEVRKKQLLNLEQYIFTSRDKVHSILDCLGWDAKEVLKVKPLVNCPIDPSHRLFEKNISEHTEKCYLKREGYDLNEKFLSEPLHNPQSSIYVENREKAAIINEASQTDPNFKRGWNGVERDPKTSDRLFSTFSSNERAALYNYVIAHTKGPEPPPEFNINLSNETNEDRPLTEEELLIRARNAKRRRIKYKAVHTNKKSYKEIMQEVINNQMEAYQEWLRETRRVSEIEVKQESIDNENVSVSQDISCGASYDYPCDNSITSRGSNYSGSSRSSRHHSRRDHEKYHHDREKEKYYDEHTKYDNHYKRGMREETAGDRRRGHYREYKDHYSNSNVHKEDKERYKEDKERYKSKDYEKGHYRDSKPYYKEHDDRTDKYRGYKEKYNESERYYKDHYGRHGRNYQQRRRSRSRSRSMHSSSSSHTSKHHGDIYKSRK